MKGLFVVCIGFLSAPALAQQGEWEQWFDFGASFEERIVAVHLVHVFDGTQGKALAITYETFGCPGSNHHQSELARLWSFPVNSPGVGTFQAVPLCGSFLLWKHAGLADAQIFVAVERRGVRLFEPRRSFRR